MRYLSLILLLLMPLLAPAQVTTSLQDGGYYYVVVQGDTVSQHRRIDTAIESASNYPDWEIVQDFRLSGTSSFYDENIIIEEVTDTVTIDPDVYESPLLHDIQWGTNGAHDSTYYDLDLSFKSAAVKVDFQLVCGAELAVQGGWLPQTTGRNGFVEHTFTLSCRDDIQIHFEASTADKIYSISEFIPAFALQLTEAEKAWVDSLNSNPVDTHVYSTDFSTSTVWEPTWGHLTYEIEDALQITIPERSIARLRWSDIHQHSNIRYHIVETLHQSHSTGAHISVRASEEPQGHAVETYLHSDGMGVSIFNDGQWSNPANMPFEWVYGDTVEYIVEVVGDTIRMKAWHIGEGEPDNWFEYSSDVIGAIPPGHFSIGSTGAGTYIINRVEVKIL